MSRPIKKRFVCHRITYNDFGPLADAAKDVKKIVLKADQLEAMRLADLEGMSQNDAAEMMNVSRQTFGRIIEEARKTVTFALINGYKLSLDYDANTEVCSRTVKCSDCGYQWSQAFAQKSDKEECPACKSTNVIKLVRCGKHCECPIRINLK